jgi:transcriptional regulator GlxA family with amidase domain
MTPTSPRKPGPGRFSRAATAPLLLLLLLLLLPLLTALAALSGSGCAHAGPSPQSAPPAREAPLRAGFLVVDGVYNSELMAPYDILHHSVFHTRPGIEVFTVSPDGEPVTTFEGLRILPHHSFADAPPIDILVVPSAEHSMDSDLSNTTLIDWVRRVGREARWVISLCDGAFVLAKAGLLDGRSATTFPDDQPRFAEMFPQVDLRINVSFVHDGKLLTSEGGSKSYDVALYLMDLLYGPEVARGIGHGLLLPWPPLPGKGPRHVAVSGAPTP